MVCVTLVVDGQEIGIREIARDLARQEAHGLIRNGWRQLVNAKGYRSFWLPDSDECRIMRFQAA